MKLAVFSDSHGSPQKMLDAIERLKPDIVVHLGDGEGDVALVKKHFPTLPLYAVKGNCDYRTMKPETKLFDVCGVKIFITHGHLYGVKSTRARLIDEAVRRGAGIAMYGHTHKAQLMQADGFTLLNPGSCGLCAAPSCAEVLIGSDGSVSAKILNL